MVVFGFGGDVGLPPGKKQKTENEGEKEVKDVFKKENVASKAYIKKSPCFWNTNDTICRLYNIKMIAG